MLAPVYAMACMWRSRDNFQVSHPPSAMVYLGIKLRLSALVSITFTPGVLDDLTLYIYDAFLFPPLSFSQSHHFRRLDAHSFRDIVIN